NWTPGDLDVYIGDADYDLFVANFKCHFPVVLDADMTGRHPATYTGIKCVRRYTTLTGKRVEIIWSCTVNAISPLLYFWSSIVVNFMTPRGAVYGYPKHTL
ncbi:hypothetical protein LXA43DRAFT_857124, partial [Ganoderma leucocontextum]